MLGQSAYLVLNSTLSCLPASSAETPCLFRGNQRAVPRKAVIRQNMANVQLSELIQNRDPTGGRSSVVGDPGHHLVLNQVARNQGSIGFHQGQLVAFSVTLPEPQQP